MLRRLLPILALLVGAPAQAALVALHRAPATTKYRDNGKPHATGRSGSATVSARALLSRSGNTELTVTTGVLDGASTGDVSKLQIKIDNAVVNYTNLVDNGTVIENLSGLKRGDVIGLQANVTGIDENRTDVVSLVETVKLRPDLAVTDLDMVPMALTNRLTTISAHVKELNGDTGAQTDCVLSIDGVVVQTIPGVWVDAGDTVSCRFRQLFTTPGHKLIQVFAANVVPWDDDTSNNSISGTLPVSTVNPTGPFDVAYMSILGLGTTDALLTNYYSAQLSGSAGGLSYSLTTTDQMTSSATAYLEELQLGVAKLSSTMQFPVSIQYSESSGDQVLLTDQGAEAATDLPGFSMYVNNGTWVILQEADFFDPDAGLLIGAGNQWVFDQTSLDANVQAGAFDPNVGFTGPLVAPPLFYAKAAAAMRQGLSAAVYESETVTMVEVLPDGTVNQTSDSVSQTQTLNLGVYTAPVTDSYGASLVVIDATGQAWGTSLASPLGFFNASVSQADCNTWTYASAGTYTDAATGTVIPLDGTFSSCFSQSGSESAFFTFVLALPSDDDVNALFADTIDGYLAMQQTLQDTLASLGF
jgi:hypothetical protein